MLLRTIRYVKLHLASTCSKFSVFASPETCTSESLLEAIRRKPNNTWWWAQIIMLLRTIRYVKLHLASTCSKFSVFASLETCTSESLLEAIRRKPAARYKDQPLPFSGLPHFPCFELALFNVVIQERKWRKEGPSQTSINKQFDPTLSPLAALAHASCIKTPTARKVARNEEAKTVRGSWSKDKLRCRI